MCILLLPSEHNMVETRSGVDTSVTVSQNNDNPVVSVTSRLQQCQLV